MTSALYINGVYESVLEEIRSAQKDNSDEVCFLQPYADDRIKLLADNPPAVGSPVRLYLSLTGSLAVVSYRALVVGWHDKRELTATQLSSFNQRMSSLQPKEKEVSLQGAGGQTSVNLISVVRVELLSDPVPVSSFTKVSDGTPLKRRSRAGGWSYVHEQPEWVGMLAETAIAERLNAELSDGIKRSLALSSEARKDRLASAPVLPEKIQILSYAFRRNPDVVAEVLLRAGGKCERCGKGAPFIKVSNGEPYLEVHHKVMLSRGGEDTVDNAYAVCPNCHRNLHFGGGEI